MKTWPKLGFHILNTRPALELHMLLFNMKGLRRVMRVSSRVFAAAAAAAAALRMPINQF